MPSVGEKFRIERERRGLTIQQAADATNIKSDHLRAIEGGRWDEFAAPVYIRGFARTYGRYLRLDVPAVAAALEAELGGAEQMREADAVAGRRRKGPLDLVMLWLSKAPWLWILLVLAALGVTAAILMAVASGSGKPQKETLPDLPNAFHMPKRVGGLELPIPSPTNAPLPPQAPTSPRRRP